MEVESRGSFSHDFEVQEDYRSPRTTESHEDSSLGRALETAEHTDTTVQEKLHEFTPGPKGKVKQLYFSQKDTEHAYVTIVKESKVGGAETAGGIAGYVDEIAGNVEELRKRRELQSEVAIAKKIAARLEERGGSSENILLDYMEVTEDSDKVGGEYTVTTSRGLWDLEEQISKADGSVFPGNLKLGVGVLKGLANMHLAGYVHGDFKLENVLVFKDGSVKIMDFGKTCEIGENNKIPNAGNARFSPPEGLLSKKGDVYSGALAVIRILEEEFLEKPTGKKEKGAPKIRRGVEQHLLETQSRRHQETTTKLEKTKLFIWESKKLVQTAMGITTTPGNQEIEKDMVAYITRLTDKLKGKYGDDKNAKEQVGKLDDLLKEMTLSNRQYRPSMADAAARLEAIMNNIAKPPESTTRSNSVSQET
ncbi:MAG: protein kinase family protein [Verrucomicrobia bacterium]|nr:protein kinase family protein [Verrucomicrobiota bacterium]